MKVAVILLILIILCLFYYAMIVAGKRADEQMEEMQDLDSRKVKIKVDPSLRKINAYFFDDNIFSFEKFCDYILCIHEDMNLSEVAEMIMELDLLVKCSGDLSDRFISLLTYSESVEELNYAEFPKIKENIRNKVYKGTYQDLMVIYLTAVFYLKHILRVKKNTI